MTGKKGAEDPLDSVPESEEKEPVEDALSAEDKAFIDDFEHELNWEDPGESKGGPDDAYDGEW